METNLIFSNASSSVKGITVSFGLLANKSAVFGWHKFGGGKPRSLRRKSNNFFLGTYSLNFAHGLNFFLKIIFFVWKKLTFQFFSDFQTTLGKCSSPVKSYCRRRRFCSLFLQSTFFSLFIFPSFFLFFFLIFCFWVFLDGRNNFRWLSSE